MPVADYPYFLTAMAQHSLLQRNSEDSEQLLKRLKQAKKEIVDEEMQKMHHYCIINDDFELSVQQMTFLMENELGNLPAQSDSEKRILR